MKKEDGFFIAGIKNNPHVTLGYHYGDSRCALMSPTIISYGSPAITYNILRNLRF